MKLFTIVKIFLFSSLSFAQGEFLNEVRQLLMERKSIYEADLKLGQTWNCKSIYYSPEKQGFVESTYEDV